MSQAKHFLPNSMLLDLHPISIALIGAGGTGSQMLTALARIDHSLKMIGRKGLDVTVYDNDRVSESNIGRQLFSPSEIGYNKAQVMTDRCNRFFGTNWTFDNKKFPHKDHEPANVIISCVDNVKSRFKIQKKFGNTNNYFRTENYPHYFMDFGNARNHGQIILGTLNEVEQPKDIETPVSKLKTIIDMFPNLSDNGDDTPSCSVAEALTEQDLFINSSLIPFGATILWNLFKNFFITSHGCYVNLQSMMVTPIKI